MRFRTNDKGFITLRFADFPNTEFELVEATATRHDDPVRAGAEPDAAASTRQRRGRAASSRVLEHVVEADAAPKPERSRPRPAANAKGR